MTISDRNLFKLVDLTSGFGSKYLHHLERCSIIIFVIDFSDPEPFKQYINMKTVLDRYDSIMLKSKSSIIVAHKIDTLLEEDESREIKLNDFKQKLDEHFEGKGEEEKPLVIPVSAEKKINLSKFLKLLRTVYEMQTSKNK